LSPTFRGQLDVFVETESARGDHGLCTCSDAELGEDPGDVMVDENPAGLTARELEVLTLLPQLRNRDIARRLSLSPRTCSKKESRNVETALAPSPRPDKKKGRLALHFRRDAARDDAWDVRPRRGVRCVPPGRFRKRRRHLLARSRWAGCLRDGVQHDRADGARMRYRGHSWERGGEMALAMNLPLLPAFMLYGLGAIPARGVLGLQMMLMLPAMLGAMLYRKEEYGAPHTAHGPRERWLAHLH
jgi:DNA-binding CsgD family transcriptional regulator